jgi:antirestriction protein ArdC
MGDWYRVIKRIKGHRYVYEQQTYREGDHVRTRNRYIGRAGSQEGSSGSLGSKGEPSGAAASLASSLAGGLSEFRKTAVNQFDAPRWGTTTASQLGLATERTARARKKRPLTKGQEPAVRTVATTETRVTNAYPRNFLGMNMAGLEEKAKEVGYNLSDVLLHRVDNTADVREKTAAIHAIWDEILERSEHHEPDRAVTTTAAMRSPPAATAPGTATGERKDAGSSGHAPRDVQAEITDTIIAAIESGRDTGTFQMPWHAVAGAGLPVNSVTHQPYHGVNVLTLSFHAMQHKWPNSWASFNQWKERGAQVRRGEHGVPIVFYTPVEIREIEKDEAGKEKVVVKTIPVFRYATVFNISQVDNPPPPPPQTAPPVNPIANAEQFITATKADIRYGGNRAYYAPARDYVQIPECGAFVGTKTSSPTEAFYGVTLHELCHWTSHASRLNRETGKRFGDEAYAAEELIAEIGAAFACAKLGITPELRQDHIQYVASWLKVLKEDKRAIFTAASAASSAVEYLETLQA